MNTSSGAASGNNPNYEVTNLNIQQTKQNADVSKPAEFKGTARINDRDVTVTLIYQRGIDSKTAQKDMQVTMQKVALLMQEKELGSVYTSATFRGSTIKLKAAKGQDAEITDKSLAKHVSKTIKNTKQEIKDLQKEKRRLEREVRELRRTDPGKLEAARENLRNTSDKLSQKKERQIELNGYTRILKNKLPKNTSTEVSTIKKEDVRIPIKLPSSSPPIPIPPRPKMPPIPNKKLPPVPNQDQKEPIPPRPFAYGSKGKETPPAGQPPSRPPIPNKGLPPTPRQAPQGRPPIPNRPQKNQEIHQPQQASTFQVPNRPPPKIPNRPLPVPQGGAKAPPRPQPLSPQSKKTTQQPPPLRPQSPPARPQRPQGRQDQFGAHDLKRALRTTPPMQTATPVSSNPKAQTITSFDRSKKLSEQALPPVLGEDFDSKNFVADDLPSDKTKVLNVMREILTTEKAFATNMNKTIKGLYALESELEKQGKELSPSIVNYREALKAILEASNQFTEKLETLHQADGKVHVSSLIDTMNSPELHVILTHLGKASTAFQAGVLSEVSKVTTGTTEKDKQVLEAVNKAIDNDPLGLGGLVIQPIQRGPRYELLARDLQKGIDPKNQTQAGIRMEKAIATIRGGISGYNEAIRRKESFDELRLLQKSSLSGGLPIWNGSEYKRVTTRNIKESDFIRTLEHLTDEEEIGGYLKARSPRELEAFKDLPKVFTAFKSVAEAKFKKAEHKSQIDRLTGELDKLSDKIISKDVDAVQFQVGQKLKVFDRLPKNSTSEFSLVKEGFEELEKWGQSVISQTKDPKIKEMVIRELAAKRIKLNADFEIFFKKRLSELSGRVSVEKVDASLLKEIQEFRKFAKEASDSGYIPSELLLSGAYSSFVRLSSSQ